MATLLGAVGPFNHDTDDWVVYSECLEQFFKANVSALQLQLTYSEKRRNRFPVLAVRPELRRLSEYCEFENTLNDMLRGRLVCGIRDIKLQRRLLAERGLTFAKAFELAQAAELAEKNAMDIQHSTTASVCTVQPPDSPAGDGVRPTQEKLQAIVDAPAPKDVSQLKSFLGLVNYYSKFLPPPSKHIGTTLCICLKKHQQWCWGAEQEEAFKMAKSQLASDVVLAHFDPQQRPATSNGIGENSALGIDVERLQLSDCVQPSQLQANADGLSRLALKGEEPGDVPLPGDTILMMEC
eukprot:Em0009g932a